MDRIKERLRKIFRYFNSFFRQQIAFDSRIITRIAKVPKLYFEYSFV